MITKKSFIGFIFSFLLLSVFITSCKKDSWPITPSDEIPKNLFLLEVGREWQFDVKETDLAGNPIPKLTGNGIIRIIRSLTLQGKHCYQMLDSILFTDTTLHYTEVNFFHIDSKGNLWQYLLFESNDPATGPGWVKIFNRELGFDKTHTILDTTFRVDNTIVQFKMTSVIKRIVSITVPLGQFNNAYPGEMEMLIKFGASSISYKFHVWLVPGVGFIKFKEPVSADFGQPQTGWRIKELRSKNF
jgi:hypothetical protein